MSQSSEASEKLQLFLSTLTFGQIVCNNNHRSRAPPTPPRSEDGKPPSVIGDGRPNKKLRAANDNGKAQEPQQLRCSETLEEMSERHGKELEIMDDLEHLATAVAEYVLRDDSKSWTRNS